MSQRPRPWKYFLWKGNHIEWGLSLSYFNPYPETFLLNEQFAKHFPRDFWCLSETSLCISFCSLGERKEVIFVTYVMPFICYLVFLKEFWGENVTLLCWQQNWQEAKRKQKEMKNNNTDSLKERAWISIPTFLRQMFTLFLLFHVTLPRAYYNIS